MKKIMFTAIAMLFITVSFAQQDTTRIRMGNKRIIIIDDKTDKSISDLNKGKEDFTKSIEINNKKIADLKDSIAKQNQLMAIENNQDKKEVLKKNVSQLEKDLAELEKATKALEKGISEIETEIAEMKKELNSENDNNDNDKNDENDENDDDSDINSHDWSDWNSFLHRHNKRYFDGHWAGFEVGINNFATKDFKMKLPTAADGIDGQFMELNTNKSWELALNFMEYEIPVITNRIGLVTGLGIQWNNYHFKNNIDLEEDVNGVIGGVLIDKTTRNYTKNSLNTIFLNAPLILEFQLPVGKHNFHISGGVVGGIKLGSKTKKFYESNDEKKRDKVKGDFQISPFHYGATVRIGYRSINLFANYNFSPLFNNNKGPELYPFTIGLTLLNF